MSGLVADSDWLQRLPDPGVMCHSAKSYRLKNLLTAECYCVVNCYTKYIIKQGIIVTIGGNYTHNADTIVLMHSDGGGILPFRHIRNGGSTAGGERYRSDLHEQCL